MNKRFDRQLYEENDKKAKEAVASLLVGTKFSVKENTKKTAVDLLLYKDGNHIGYVECERKLVWDGPFKWNTIQIPERKAKYTKLDKPTIFVIFDKNFQDYFSIKQEDLLKSPLVEVPNKYVYKGEKFFQVPINKAKYNGIC